MLAEFAHRRPPDRADVVGRHTTGPVSAWAPDEIGLALTLSRGTASARLERSVRLAEVLRATLAAWDQGRIDQAKVNAIPDATLALSDTAAQAVQDRVLSKAPTQTVAQLRAALERAVIAADPAAADTRHGKAYRQRRVALNPDRDGMASLWALLSAPDAVTCYGWLTALARGLPAADTRGMDARRADLLVALLTGNLLVRPPTGDDTHPAGERLAGCETAGGNPACRATTGCEMAAADRGDGSIGATVPLDRSDLLAPVAPAKPLVHLVMPLTTLVGADDSPVELTGYGPLPPALARTIAADAVGKRLITGHCYHSQPFDYRPEPDLVAAIAALDQAALDQAARDRAGCDSTAPAAADRAHRSPFDRHSVSADDSADSAPF